MGCACAHSCTKSQKLRTDFRSKALARINMVLAYILPSFFSLIYTMSNPRSLPIWLRPTGGQWTRYSSATEATDYLTTAHGLKIYRTQVTRAAEKQKTRDGWEFTDKDPGEAPPRVPEDAPAQLRPTALTSYFSTISAPCACCDEKLHGAIVRCTLCQKDAHEICTQHGKCLRCVCRVCDCACPSVCTVCIVPRPSGRQCQTSF